MKKTVLAVAVVFLLGACLPFTPTPDTNPNLDLAGTAEANLETAVAQTLTAQPTITRPPSSDTPAPTITSEVAVAPTMTASPITALTPTSELITSTNIPPTIPAGAATATPTLGILTYGTLPPAVPFSNITLINRSKSQAYISLQVVTAEGGPTIIEYPVSGQIKIQAPTGQYLYVAWVGGRKMVGEFKLGKDNDLTIILYKDKVVIK